MLAGNFRQRRECSSEGFTTSAKNFTAMLIKFLPIGKKTNWEENETNVVEAGPHMVPHLIHDPMVEIYIVRALGILQAEGILHNTGVKMS